MRCSDGRLASFAFWRASRLSVQSLPVLQPGSYYDLSVKLLPGKYELWCSIANHRQLGMVATLIVALLIGVVGTVAFAVSISPTGSFLALVPIMMAVTSIMTTFLVVWGLTAITPVSPIWPPDSA